MENQEVLDVKMLLESLSDIVNKMGGCSMKVDYRKPSRVAEDIDNFDDLKDSKKVPILVGELSTTAHQSLLMFYVGTYGYIIETSNSDGIFTELLSSKKEFPRGNILLSFYYFREQCISTSLHVSRKKICDAITEKETILESNKGKKEYNGNNDKAMLAQLQEELVKFDKKFSKFKK